MESIKVPLEQLRSSISPFSPIDKKEKEVIGKKS
jgi:hypothetical protein